MSHLSRKDDQGSAMVIAMTVVLITATLSLGLLARALNGLSSSRSSQDFSGALASADAGLSDALFRMDQIGTDLASTFCVGAGCTVTSVPGNAGVVYKATAVNNNTYLVQAKGMENGVPHAIEATVRRDLAFPFAVFGDSSIDFNGNSDDKIYTVDENGNPIAEPEAYAGSNGTITCNGGAKHPAKKHVVYPGGSTNCSFPVAAEDAYQPLDPVSSCPAPVNTPPTPCLPATYNACPVGGTFPAIINPGVYYCTSTVNLPPTVTVGAGSTNDGVVEIFVIPPGNSNADINMSGSKINEGGDPTKFRMYMAGSGNVLPGTGDHGATYTGIMYAPSSNMTSNGCKVVWRGAIVFNTVTCNGGAHLTVLYDVRVTSILQANWTVYNYHEVPSNQVSVP